ncbi:MAG: SIR2 family protein [Clostridia bacterium]|nr:SIR2 family protein [Clostridia bacterium]
MFTQKGFTHYLNGNGRPKILLIGNGLERVCGGDDWQKLLEDPEICKVDKTVRDVIKDLPFPLKYELMSTEKNPHANFTAADLDEESRRLSNMMKKIMAASIDIDGSHALFKKLTELDVDHIFTTNYSYCPEKAFLPKRSFASKKTRMAFRFSLHTDNEGRQKQERSYRIHTGYLMRSEKSGREVGIWHIHGECSVPTGVVLGHDKYGRLLSRIVNTCCGIDYDNKIRNKPNYTFTSWPELFLFGDIYVLGFGLYECEFDLWWLLRRKQREKYADGKVYYYQHDPLSDSDPHQLLLRAHGVEIVTNEYSDGGKDTFADYYNAAFEDIKARLESLK